MDTYTLHLPVNLQSRASRLWNLWPLLQSCIELGGAWEGLQSNRLICFRKMQSILVHTKMIPVEGNIDRHTVPEVNVAIVCAGNELRWALLPFPDSAACSVTIQGFVQFGSSRQLIVEVHMQGKRKQKPGHSGKQGPDCSLWSCDLEYSSQKHL